VAQCMQAAIQRGSGLHSQQQFHCSWILMRRAIFGSIPSFLNVSLSFQKPDAVHEAPDVCPPGSRGTVSAESVGGVLLLSRWLGLALPTIRMGGSSTSRSFGIHAS
jgi:hypothetical protein